MNAAHDVVVMVLTTPPCPGSRPNSILLVFQVEPGHTVVAVSTGTAFVVGLAVVDAEAAT
jgi:hypothetical protein